MPKEEIDLFGMFKVTIGILYMKVKLASKLERLFLDMVIRRYRRQVKFIAALFGRFCETVSYMQLLSNKKI